MICNCPTYISTIPAVSCPTSLGQIARIAFQRLYNPNEHDIGGKNSILYNRTGGGFFNLAAWKALMAAANDAKIVVSPILNAPAESGGDARLTSGGNDDLGGSPDVLGDNPVQFTASLRGCPQSVILAIKDLMCEKDLGVYLFDADGRMEGIWHPQRGEEPSTYYVDDWINPNDNNGYGALTPIPIRSLFVGSKIHGNYDAKDSNILSFYYAPTNGIRLINTDLINGALSFNPVTDL